ncbi:hypothetical protein FRX31_013558 [Thalictrum thalictroides]|uniref:Uncharacterized protein n=1 Tax=Thalictrum thalictroides TaxID=46969 RepID=A0A7J6WHD7_THATH|nr:hypothetical protein FRX31_013558 [Thalictrum thalictroides]
MFQQGPPSVHCYTCSKKCERMAYRCRSCNIDICVACLDPQENQQESDPQGNQQESGKKGRKRKIIFKFAMNLVASSVGIPPIFF